MCLVKRGGIVGGTWQGWLCMGQRGAGGYNGIVVREMTKDGIGDKEDCMVVGTTVLILLLPTIWSRTMPRTMWSVAYD